VKPLSVSSPKPIFENQFLRLSSVLADFGSLQKEYFVIDKGTRVGGLIIRGNEVLLVRQYRFLIDDHSWEIPGGGVDEGESPSDALVRECREEAAVDCVATEAMFSYRLGLDMMAAEIHLFRVRDFRDIQQARPNVETDTSEWVSVTRCLERIRSGEIRDLMTILALLLHTHPLLG
jgi:8-oxo-dGTP pyrophosphatase MutT (NUDIX family)